MAQETTAAGMTIDELARESGMTARNIRAHSYMDFYPILCAVVLPATPIPYLDIKENRYEIIFIVMIW